MKPISVAVVASLVTAGSAQPHRHAHHHDKRVLKTVVVNGPTETVYELVGVGIIPADEALKGIESGLYVVKSKPDPNVDGKAVAASSDGIFKEGPSASGPSDDDDEEPSPSPPSPPASSPDAPAPPSGGSGLDAEFPSGTLDCSSFPDGYGALKADWLNMGGWLGIQWGFSNIRTGIGGDGCSPGAHCSYLCPEGYEKTQWPERQGSTLESIGGLYCNDNGKLELSRPEVKTLCTKGAGGVFVKNSLSQKVYVCRTDYPGTEAMVIPIGCEPGGDEHELTNPYQTTYMWDGKKTSAQYYINPAGLSRDDSCVWDSAAAPGAAGDKAPTNFGTGMDDGTTYWGLFPNSAVSKAVLEFNVRVFVEGEEVCKLENGVYSGGPNGCTGAAAKGKKTLMEFY